MLLPLLLALQAPDVPQRMIIERDWLEQLALIGQSLTSVLVLVLLVAATFALLALRKALDELTRLVRSTSSDITAAVHDAREVADELRRLTGRVRDTADLVTSGVRKFRDRGERRERERAERPARVERTSAPATDSESDAGSEGGDEAPMERGERGDRADRERRKRRRRRGGERPRSGDGAPPPPASGDTPAE